MGEITPIEEMKHPMNRSETKYYIYQRELFRVCEGESMPDAWDKGTWVKRPFAFRVEATGRLISKEEAKGWIRDHLRSYRIRSRD